MNRRYMIMAGAAAIASPLLPASEARTVSAGAVEWLQRVSALGYDLRRQYVAGLRAMSSDYLVRQIADLIEDVNERGGFA